MPQFPNWSSEQYLDAPTFNTAFGAVSGSFAQTASGLSKPGLVRPDAASYTPSGLTLAVSAPSPFQVLFGSGILSAAHGTTTGADTQSYNVAFSGVVPGSGSVTAYLIASYQQIQQNSFTVVGPPVGHPDYNPNFVPYTAYATLVDSIALSATTSAPDNVMNIELGRFTLSAGATGLPTLNTAFQQRASGLLTTHVATVTGTTSLAITQAGQRIQVTGPGTITLPAVSGADGTLFPLSSTTSGTVNINAAGSDLIYGLFANPASGVAQISLVDGAAVTLEANFGIWQIVGGSAQGIGVTAASGYVQQSGSVASGHLAIWDSNLLISDSGISPSSVHTFVAAVSGAAVSGDFGMFADTNGTLKDLSVKRSAALTTVAMASGTIASGHIAVFADTNGTIMDGGAPVSAAALTVGYRQLFITNGVASGSPGSNTQISLTAAQAVIQTSAGVPIAFSNVSVTINTGTNGAGGLDTGVISNNTFYAVYLISNGSAIAGLISLSATTPTLPGGYTYFGRFGWVKINGSGALYGFTQYGNSFRYVAAPLITNSFSSPLNITVSNVFVPTTAFKIALVFNFPGGGSYPSVIIGVDYNGSPDGFVATTANADGSGAGLSYLIQEIQLIGTTIYWSSQFSGSSINCHGWTDNL